MSLGPRTDGAGRGATKEMKGKWRASDVVVFTKLLILTPLPMKAAAADVGGWAGLVSAIVGMLLA